MRESLSRAAVVAAARELLIRDGLVGLSLRRLASSLDVTAAALYAYVDNKQDLLEAVIEQEFELLIEQFAAVCEGDPIERMCRMCQVYVDYARRNPTVFQAMFLFRAQLSPAHAVEDDFAMATRAFQSARGPLLDAIQEGLLRPLDSLLAHLTVWTAVHGVATVLLMGPELGADGADELAGTLIDTVIRGLCTAEGIQHLDRVSRARHRGRL